MDPQFYIVSITAVCMFLLIDSNFHRSVAAVVTSSQTMSAGAPVILPAAVHFHAHDFILHRAVPASVRYLFAY